MSPSNRASGGLDRQRLRVVRGGRPRPEMKLVVLGEGNSPMVDQFVARLQGLPIEVVLFEGDDEHLDPNVVLTHARGADAGIDMCVLHPDLKMWALDTLDKVLGPDAPLLSCCHATSATGSASVLAHPERLTGFALLPPWDDRHSVECARAMQSSDAAVAAATALWQALGFEPTWVNDSVGLIMPRIVACLVNEAMFATMEHVAKGSDIDRAMELGTRYPRGPLAWGDLMGFDQVLAILDALAMEHGEDRYRAAPLLRRLVQAGWTRNVVW